MEELIKYYLNLLIIQYRNKPKAKATIETLVKSLFEDVNGNIFGLEYINAFDLDTAELAQLEVLAKYIGYDNSLEIINTNFFRLSDMEGLDETPGLSDMEERYSGYPILGYSGYTYTVDTLSGIAGINFYRKVLGFLSEMKNEVLSLGNLDKLLYKYFDLDIFVEEGDKTIKYVYSEALLKLFNLDINAINIFIKKYMPRPMGCTMEESEFKPEKYLEFTINTTDTLIYTINYNSQYGVFRRMMVDWGDGNINFYNSPDILPTHAYSQQQDYTIKVISLEGGALPAIIFGNQYRPDDNSNALKSIDFNNCFFQHSPDDIVTRFDFMFCNCTNLISITPDLFKANGDKAISFYRTFYNCGLTIIPADLFKYNTNALIFKEAFAYNLLEEIPDGLFKYIDFKDNPNFEKTFYYIGDTNSCKINSNIFCNEATEKTTKFKNVVPNFYMTFARGYDFAGVQGTAPELWSYTFKSTPNGRNCFLGQDSNSLSNYSNIPNDWGGN